MATDSNYSSLTLIQNSVLHALEMHGAGGASTKSQMSHMKGGTAMEKIFPLHFN